jgi:predicted Zn-dependent protease
MLHGTDNRIDSQVMLCALYRRENQPRKAIPLVQDLIQRYPRNYLLRLELAQMYSMAGEGAAGLHAIAEVAALKARNAPGYDRLSWERIYYQEGAIQFWYRDLGAALENLKKAAAAGEQLDLNTGALVWLRMGQIYDLTNRRALALDAYKRSITFAPDAEAAQESKKYLGTPYRRT